MADIVSMEICSGKPVHFRGFKLLPFSQTVQIKLPGLLGGMVWNRPQSVLVIDGEGQEQVLPVRDVTRWIVWSLMGAAGLMAVIFWIIDQNRKE